MKELYEDPKSEIIVFEAEDVITDSCIHHCEFNCGTDTGFVI